MGCYNCGQEGHMSRECTEPKKEREDRPPRACFNCGQEGHNSRDCTEPRKEREDRPSRACFNCGQEGHNSRDCTEPKKEREDRPSRACFNCGEEGHSSRDCTEPRKEREDKPRGCFNCGQEGHSKQDCPEPPKPRGCFNCGEEGHMSKECTNPRKENVEGRPPRREGAEGEEPKIERYVPPEMLEGEAIFEERNKVYEGSGINFSKYSSIPCKITGVGAVPSAETFKDLTLRDFVLQNLDKCGYKQPTPIQKHGSPQLMMGKHVMCCAQTGSGKTAAFLLPIINTLLNNQNEITPPGTSPATPEALIMAPTRELAIQIGNEANMYSNGSILRTQVVYGGTATFSQKSKLIRGCNILVATPGRLKQFVKDQVLDLSKVQFFILDEADRMLDMGFMPDVEEIVGYLPSKDDRVSGMFSATFPDAIQQAAKKFLLDDYIYIVIGVVGGACTDVSQDFVEVERMEKRAKVLEIIQEQDKSTKILVFCASKKGADFLASYLSNNHVSTTSIHGDRLQSQREAALREFTLGQRQVLVATAVAARGLDIPKVSLVINYDLPSEVDEYVHRIGRTGRVGHTGRAISFFDKDQDSEVASKLVSILKDAGQNVPDFITGCGENGYGGGDTFNSTDNRGDMANGGGGNAGDDDDW